MDHGLPETNKACPRMVTLKEFATLMSVCPNTIRKWMDQGVLVEDRLFLRTGRVIRFPWSSDTATIIMNACAEDKKSKQKQTRTNGSRQALRYRV